ncbi:MAG: hypothetical protein H6553_10990 [Chitinophagales bacterium]|nr:hypothetical protein [Chitinophagales bacterium]
MKKVFQYILILITVLLFSTASTACSKKMGCPQDQYNDWKKIQENNKAMQKNKFKKQKGKASNDMSSQESQNKKSKKKK